MGGGTFQKQLRSNCQATRRVAPHPVSACGEATPALKGGEEDLPKFELSVSPRLGLWQRHTP